MVVEATTTSFPTTPSNVVPIWTDTRNSTHATAPVDVQCLPPVASAEIKSRRPSQTQSHAKAPASRCLASAVRGLNSVGFLKELVRVKRTVGEVKYSTISTPPPTLPLGTNDSTPPQTRLATRSTNVRGGSSGKEYTHENEQDASLYMTCCEYNGNLWFLPSKLIRFREIIRVVPREDPTEEKEETIGDPSAATVYCETQFRSGQEWVDCARVKCTVSSSSAFLPKKRGLVTSLKDGDGNLHFHVDSELLVQIPLAGGAIRRKINSAFQSALLAYFDAGNAEP